MSYVVACKEDIAVSTVLCLGYPLKSRNGAVQDEILLQLTVPIMFVQGSKDEFCPLEKLGAVCKKMKSMNELLVIDGGNHSFKIAKELLQTKKTRQYEIEDLAFQAIAAFISRSLGQRPMTHVPLIIHFGGSWESSSKGGEIYKGGKIKGLAVPKNVRYRELLNKLFDLLGINPTNVRMRAFYRKWVPSYLAPCSSKPADIRNDPDVQFLVILNTNVTKYGGLTPCFITLHRRVFVQPAVLLVS